MGTSAEQMRRTLDKLFADAGYSSPELVAYIEQLEQEHTALTKMVRKLKLEAVRKSGSNSGMNSRLSDALRE